MYKIAFKYLFYHLQGYMSLGLEIKEKKIRFTINND